MLELQQPIRQFYIWRSRSFAVMQRQQLRSNLNFLLTRKNVIGPSPSTPQQDLFLQIPNFTFEEQSLKAFNHRLKQCLKEREGNKGQQSHHCQTEEQLDRKSNHKKMIVDDHAKTRIDLLSSSNPRRRRFSKDIYSQGKNKTSNKKCSFPAPLENQEEANESGYPQYYQRLISCESSKILLDRILKRKKDERKLQEQNSNRFVRCPLNHRIFNRLCKKDSLNALIIEESPSNTTSPSKTRHKIFNEKRTRKIDPLLSPPKPAQAIFLPTKKPTQIETECEQLSPWSIDHISLEMA